MTDQNSPQFTTTSEPKDPTQPDVAPGVEQGPDIDIPPDNEPLPPDDSGTTVVDDTTPGGD